MKGNKNKISNKYIKIMLLALLVISSILSVYLVTKTNTKVFNAKIINQKADTREVVNIPDQDLKEALLLRLKLPLNERGTDSIYHHLRLSDVNYVKPSDENEVYKDEMEKILEINLSNTNDTRTTMDLTGLETAVNLSVLYIHQNNIENLEPLRGLTNLTRLYIANNKIENIEPLKGLINLKDLYINNNKIENIEPLRGLTKLTRLVLSDNKIENLESLSGLKNLSLLELGGNKIENIEPLRGLINLTNLKLEDNKINNIDLIRDLNNLNLLGMFNEEINVSPNTYEFNLPILKKYNGEILDIVGASNGLLKKNENRNIFIYKKSNRTSNYRNWKRDI